MASSRKLGAIHCCMCRLRGKEKIATNLLPSSLMKFSIFVLLIANVFVPSNPLHPHDVRHLLQSSLRNYTATYPCHARVKAKEDYVRKCMKSFFFVCDDGGFKAERKKCSHVKLINFQHLF